MSSSPANPADPYFKTKVMTASSAQLRQMLFDGAIKFAQQAMRGLADNDHEAAYEGIIAHSHTTMTRHPSLISCSICCLSRT